MRKSRRLQFRIVSLLAVAIIVCLGAWTLRPKTHPQEVTRVLSELPQILTVEEMDTQSVLEILLAKNPEFSDFYIDIDSGTKRYFTIDISEGYLLVVYLKNKDLIEHIEVRTWCEKASQWNSEPLGQSRSNRPSWMESPTNKWAREQLERPVGGGCVLPRQRKKQNKTKGVRSQ